MKSLVIGGALLAVFAASAQAEMRYDRKLEQWAMERVAIKIGAIRGGFDYDRTPVAAVHESDAIDATDPVTTGSIWLSGLRLRFAAMPEGPVFDVNRPAPRIVEF